jgi:PAS domain S-box-containing protein
MLRAAVNAAAWAVIAIALAQLGMSTIRPVWLEALYPDVYNMVPNTALALIASGAGFIAIDRGQRHAAFACGAIALVIGGLSLLQHITGIDLGVDHILRIGGDDPTSLHPGRVSPGTSLALTCVGVGLFVLTRARASAAYTDASEIIGFFVFALGAGGAAGYLLGVDTAYDWGSYTRMAPHTAASLMLVGAAALASTWHRQNQRIAAIPLWAPAVLCFLVLLLDISTPRGLATAIAYIPLVFCSLWFSRPHAPFVFAAVATILASLAIFAKADVEVAPWVVTTNRAMAIGAIWAVALLIHLRRQTETALLQTKKAAALLASIVESSGDAVVSQTFDGKISYWNAGAERLFGHTSQEAIGQSGNLIVPADCADDERMILAKVRAGGTIENFETESLCRHGVRRHVSMTISPVRDGTGVVFAVSKVARDIADRKDAESELLRHAMALERSNRDLDDFAYIASHDLKEPLRGLSNNAKFLHDDHGKDLGADGIRRLDRIRYLSERMGKLIDDLLYFSRIGRQDMAVQTTDLNTVIADIAADIEAASPESRAALCVPQPLPEIACDKTRVTEVFRNLISNALKYNDRPHKIVEVGCFEEMVTPRGRLRHVFYVKDNGIGIAKEFHDEVFRIFKRLNEEDETKKGTGAGLTFVRKIVERHGGRIWLDSAPGEGTTFYFTLRRQGPVHAAA